jgi:hypothetical protein
MAIGVSIVKSGECAAPTAPHDNPAYASSAENEIIVFERVNSEENDPECRSASRLPFLNADIAMRRRSTQAWSTDRRAHAQLRRDSPDDRSSLCRDFVTRESYLRYQGIHRTDQGSHTSLGSLSPWYSREECMRSYRVNSFGNFGGILMQDDPEPQVGPHDVLIRIAATSLK